jgi:hypothetical protein
MKFFNKVFLFVLEQLKAKKLLKGKTLGVDATTLEANAAMRSIVRKETGEDWKEYLRELAKEEGIENPSDEDIQRIDRGRKGKKVSNKEWQSKTDPDSRITKMKDGRTHLAYKAEHSVDLETEAIVSCHVTHADQGDTTTGPESLILAEANLQLIESERTVEEAVMDKGYHSNALLERLTQWGIRTYIPEKKQKKRKWADKPESYEHAFRGNRRRIRSDKGKGLSRKRSELVERTFAHVCETGAGRRTWLHGMENVTKIHTLKCAAFNLGLLMRKIFGLAKPRNWEASLATALAAAFFMIFGEWMTQGAAKMAPAVLVTDFHHFIMLLDEDRRGTRFGSFGFSKLALIKRAAKGCSGFHFAKKLECLHSSPPVMLMSGESCVLNSQSPSNVKGFIPKPFSVKYLVRNISDMKFEASLACC